MYVAYPTNTNYYTTINSFIQQFSLSNKDVLNVVILDYVIIKN